MGTLKSTSNNSPTFAVQTLPDLELPPVHPKYGTMTQAHADAIIQHLSSLNSTLHQQLSTLGATVDDLKSQLNNLKK